MLHISKLYQWQKDMLAKHSNVIFKVSLTGEEQEGYKVINALNAHIIHANGKSKIESYKL